MSAGLFEAGQLPARKGDIGMQKHHVMICILAALFLAAGFVLCVFGTKPVYSDSERRYLAPKPRLTADTVKSGHFMEEFEAYALDTFPFREKLRTVRAWTGTKLFRFKDQHGLYCSDGYFAAMEYPVHEDSVRRAALQFASVCRQYLTKDQPVYLSVIPDKNCFLARKSGRLSMDYAAFENCMKQQMPFAQYIPISDLLELEDYYRTDPHWRQEKITGIAKRLAERMGSVLDEDYTMHTLEQEFYGAYYGQTALSSGPDTLHYLTGRAIDSCSVYDWQNAKQIPVYDKNKAAGKDAYELFLSGPLSLLTMENPKAHNQKRLVIFRDSFGSALAPLLVSGYEKITLVDIRYIRPELLGRFLDFSGCDVLFLYSTLVLNHSETFAGDVRIAWK